MTAKLFYENRFIVANCTYEGEEFQYKFSRSCSVSHIWATLPKLITDELVMRRIRARVAA
ncbi:hypothetical protein COJ96_09800 [Bacillus sp. AFS073361]|uniref:hypothetical protein n=1 Tax=Bacillus sp. AFS073361 TaxID=2033511 RepID=UPI000BF3C65C|nr:hypothetical protein [Bacillus sp. AFS073361]PFP29435.1 hypothetical protein COJ96_09800 [Bacillus sp. AFS073361]